VCVSVSVCGVCVSVCVSVCVCLCLCLCVSVCVCEEEENDPGERRCVGVSKGEFGKGNLSLRSEKPMILRWEGRGPAREEKLHHMEGVMGWKEASVAWPGRGGYGSTRKEREGTWTYVFLL